MKRARQLVKKERARWVDAETICLIAQSEEEYMMTSLKAEAQTAVLVEHPTEHREAYAAPAADLDDEAIRDLARRRLATKRSLIGQFFEWLLIGFTMILLANFSFYDGLMLGFLFCAAWGIRFIYRVIKFMRPTFKGGIAAYLQKRREQQLEFEYGRLKKLGADYVTNELNR